jgi:hypothetical protein
MHRQILLEASTCTQQMQRTGTPTTTPTGMPTTETPSVCIADQDTDKRPDNDTDWGPIQHPNIFPLYMFGSVTHCSATHNWSSCTAPRSVLSCDWTSRHDTPTTQACLQCANLETSINSSSPATLNRRNGGAKSRGSARLHACSQSCWHILYACRNMHMCTHSHVHSHTYAYMHCTHYMTHHATTHMVQSVNSTKHILVSYPTQYQ